MRCGEMRSRRRLRLHAALLVGAVAFVVGPSTLAAAINACSAGPQCPIAKDDMYVVTVGAPLSVAAPGLLANDSGIAGTVVDVASSESTSADNATVDVRADGSFTYTPDAHDPVAGDDSFEYQIKDPQGGYDLATATIEVDPIVRADLYTTPRNTTLSVAAPGVFANDVGIDGASVRTGHAPDAGIEVNDDGSFVYKPPAAFTGTVTFTYTVSDSSDDNDFTATVTIGVGSPPATASTVTQPIGGTVRPKATPASTAPTRPVARVTAPHQDGGSSRNVPAVVVGVAVILFGAAGLWLLRRERRA